MGWAHHDDGHDRAGAVLLALPSVDGWRGVGEDAAPVGGGPWLRVRSIERTALIRFEDAEMLFEEEVVRILGERLDWLIKDEGHSRLVINLSGVQYLSSAVLGKLAWVAKRIEPVGGRIQLCGLDPLLRDILRITGLDGVFDIYSNEAEALGLIVQW